MVARIVDQSAERVEFEYAESAGGVGPNSDTAELDADEFAAEFSEADDVTTGFYRPDYDSDRLLPVQRAPTAGTATRAGETGVPESVRDVVSSPGRSLDPSIQRTMEARMGDSLGDVRVHTGPKAAAACEAINARAFTVGNHVAFGAGEYDPESEDGQHVIAHELAHVRQQTGGAVSMLPREDAGLEIDPDPQLEREAEETAERVMGGDELGIQRLGGTDVHVQRWTDQPRDKIGRFDFKDEKAYPDKKYGIEHRPPYAPGQVEEVWQRAIQESPDGKVRDPNNPSIVLEWNRSKSRRRQWHMGHRPGREYRYLLKFYLEGVISEDRFIKECQNAEHYQPEAPKENMSRKHESSGQYWEKKFGSLESDM
ncbi:eCIS core domain-containing protein [Halovivax asiaticus]